VHRASALACDAVRAPGEPRTGTVGSNPLASCSSDVECTQGTNGRCSGNGHDGWQCTYDGCSEDAECGAGVCACEGGSRSDNNVCLTGNCRVDAECGGGKGYCSPTLGSCGNYTKAVGYFCHTPQDECIDDADCEAIDAGPSRGGPGYCAYAETVGHWTCSWSHCAG
jgi:hypothetical protein